MKHSYKDGKIVLFGKYWETADYDVASDLLSVRFDGTGSITKYILTGNKTSSINRTFLNFAIDGQPLDAYADKNTEMIGRFQKFIVNDDGYTLSVEQFVGNGANGVFFDIAFKSETPRDVEIALYHNKGESEAQIEGNSVCVNDAVILSSEQPNYRKENSTCYYKKRKTIDFRLKLFFSCGNSITEAKYSFDNFDLLAEKEKKIISDIKLPSCADTEEKKAFYYSCYLCALTNYTESGEFKGFCAGCNYKDIIRTYYRDSYWTSLSAYNGHSELIRNQIITLSRGIAGDGTCPSAVRQDFSAWWGNHFDSPSFLPVMTADYIHNTGDLSILFENANGKTVLEKCSDAISALEKYVDETGLIYKPGKFNRRDWADEVNRSGYVTYVEALYAHALHCMSELYDACGLDGKPYTEKFKKVKNAINEILWDNEKGYYVNFKDADFTEDNLSIDTVLTVLYGIADHNKSKRVLENMINILETRNNRSQKAGDYGVMCVYPFYKRFDGATNKSAQTYYYHNGANWPYLSAIYAYALYLYGYDYEYALYSWFEYNVAKGNYTPIEFFSPCRNDGSLLQAWSGVGSFVMDEISKNKKPI